MFGIAEHFCKTGFPIEALCVYIHIHTHAHIYMCVYIYNVPELEERGENSTLPVLSFTLYRFPSRGFCMKCSRVQFTSLKVTRMFQHESRD